MTAIGSAGAMRTAVAGLTVIAAVLLTGAIGVSPAAAADAPPGERITVDVVAVNGSGCPAGTASARMSPDNTGFHINYSNFIARDGAGAAPTAFRRNCQVGVLVHVPQGFTYAVASAEYRGRAALSSGSTALHRNNYYFQGVGEQNNVTDHHFYGAFNGSWRTHDATTVTELEYKPCGRDVILNINTELRVDSPGSASWISLRSSEGDVDTLVQFNWKTC
jgi:hypothetical protein